MTGVMLSSRPKKACYFFPLSIGDDADWNAQLQGKQVEAGCRKQLNDLKQQHLRDKRDQTRTKKKTRPHAAPKRECLRTQEFEKTEAEIRRTRTKRKKKEEERKKKDQKREDGDGRLGIRSQQAEKRSWS